MSEPARDPRQVLAAFAEQKLSLELSTLDLCFLLMLRVVSRNEASNAFDEERLADAFEQVCEAVEPETENVRTRATHTIRRLREQRLLARVDAAGVLRAGEFSLSPLAVGIVDFYLAGQSLTRESLGLLTRTLIVTLVEVLAVARKGPPPEQWESDVIGPLRVTVTDLIGNVETRQRNLDLEQENFQKRIATLLSADWFGALEQCQALLETTATTLAELNDVLLRGSHELSALLQELLTLSTEAGHVEAEQAVVQVMELVDRMAAWGSVRQRAWSEYYEYVHRYLRDVVRFDPSRALTQRLRKLLRGESGQAYALTVASAAPIRLLREVRPPEQPPPVRRKKRPKDEKPTEEEPQPDPEQVLEAQVRELLNEGVTGLGELTARLTQDLSPANRFLLAGRIAKALSRVKRPIVGRERAWVKVDEDLALEQWEVRAEGDP